MNNDSLLPILVESTKNAFLRNLK